MGRYILNSAVITAPGTYEYRLIDTAGARQWLDLGGWISTIGYVETAEALSALTGRSVPGGDACRRNVVMQAGEEALVFRLVLPPGTPRVRPGDKGRLSAEFVAAHCEIGVLVRTS